MALKAALLAVSVILLQQVLQSEGKSVSLRRKLVEDDRPVVAQYYTNYSFYRSTFYPWNVDFETVTHLVYGFYGISDDCEVESQYEDGLDDARILTEVGMSYSPEYAGPKGLIGAFKLLQGILEAKDLPVFKLMLSIGGWKLSGSFSLCTSTEDNRGKLIESIKNVVDNLGLDGIDLSWPFGSSPDHYDNYLMLISEMKEMLKNSFGERKYISAVQGMIPEVLESVDGRLCKDVDFLFLKAYDYSVALNEDSETGISSGLYADGGEENDPRYNVSWGVGKLSSVCPMNKMVLGIAPYGRCWRGADDNNNGLFQPSDGPCVGTWELGLLPFWHLHDHHINEYDNFWNVDTMTPYLHNDDGQFVSYDNEMSVGIKAVYAKGLTMPGLMFSDASDDKEMPNDDGVDFLPGHKIKKYRLLSSSVVAWNSDGSSTTTSTACTTTTTAKHTGERWNNYFRRFIKMYLDSFDMNDYFDKYISRFIDHYIQGTAPNQSSTTSTSSTSTVISPSSSSTSTSSTTSSTSTAPTSSTSTKSTSSTSTESTSSTSTKSTSSTSTESTSSTSTKSTSSTSTESTSSTSTESTSSTSTESPSSTKNSSTSTVSTSSATESTSSTSTESPSSTSKNSSTSTVSTSSTDGVN